MSLLQMIHCYKGNMGHGPCRQTIDWINSARADNVDECIASNHIHPSVHMAYDPSRVALIEWSVGASRRSISWVSSKEIDRMPFTCHDCHPPVLGIFCNKWWMKNIYSGWDVLDGTSPLTCNYGVGGSLLRVTYKAGVSKGICVRDERIHMVFNAQPQPMNFAHCLVIYLFIYLLITVSMLTKEVIKNLHLTLPQLFTVWVLRNTVHCLWYLVSHILRAYGEFWA